MTNRYPFGSSGRPLSELEFRVYDCLVREREFLRSEEIVEKARIRIGQFYPIIDALYDSRLVMARFMLWNQAIIVTCDEVPKPEIGFNRQLDILLTGIGMDSGNWLSVTKQYAALEQDGGFPDSVPDSVAPLQVYCP